MDAGKRIALNTAVQYVKMVIYMALTLFSTRYILAALGQSDFGLYSVIAGVVSLFSFITTSLATSTQRFLSYNQGKDDIQEVRAVFGNAFFIHLCIAACLIAFMLVFQEQLVGGLKIPTGREETAFFVYYMVVGMVSMTFVASPLRALYIARENIAYVAIVEIMDAVLRFAGAVMLMYVTFDTLKLYAILMAALSMFNLLAFAAYAGMKYPECHFPRWREITLRLIRQLTGFAFWNVYAVGGTVIRTQGLAVIFNRAAGTIMNAAYGIALQVNNAVGSIAVSIITAINPQLMKAEGRGDRQQMFLFSTKESKYSLLVLSTLLIPAVAEMPAILQLWLGRLPEHTVLFCRAIVIAYIIDQATIGLTAANQAIGRIRNYTLIVTTTRLLILPIAWLCLKAGYTPLAVMAAYIAVEATCGIVRIPLLHYSGGLDVAAYVKDAILRPTAPILVNVALSVACASLFDGGWRFVLTEVVGAGGSAVIIYHAALDTEERQWLRAVISRLTTRLPWLHHTRR